MSALRLCLCAFFFFGNASSSLAHEADATSDSESWLAQSLLSDNAYQANLKYIDCTISVSFHNIYIILEEKKAGSSENIHSSLMNYYEEKYRSQFSVDRASLAEKISEYSIDERSKVFEFFTTKTGEKVIVFMRESVTGPSLPINPQLGHEQCQDPPVPDLFSTLNEEDRRLLAQFPQNTGESLTPSVVLRLSGEIVADGLTRAFDDLDAKFREAVKDELE